MEEKSFHRSQPGQRTILMSSAAVIHSWVSLGWEAEKSHQTDWFPLAAWKIQFYAVGREGRKSFISLSCQDGM